MPDILGVTNPVPGHEPINRNTPISPNDTQIQNIPDPTRVGRPDMRTEQQDAGNNQKLQYDSNFLKFVQRLRDSPDALQSLSRILFAGTGTIVSSGMTEGLAEEMAKYLQMIQVDEGQLMQLMSNQLGAGARFHGALFDLLRDCYTGAQSEGMRNDILQFLKKWNDNISTKHIEGNLMRNLSRIASSITSRWSGPLNELMAKLRNGFAAGGRADNLKLLQNQIIPFMGEYVARTHDLGPVRDLLTMLSLDITRYENGAEDGMLQAFRQLYGYAGLRDRLGEIDDHTLLKLLHSTDFARAKHQDQLGDQFAALASRVMQGEGGKDLMQAFEEILRSALINESVYMPLNHMLLPLEWEGRKMCSEMWVDPDTEDCVQRGGERTMRFLLKFDIQELGAFDLVLTYRKGGVDIDVRCPKRLGPFTELIQSSLAGLAERDGLSVQSLRVAEMKRPLTISEVFPKIYERKNGVNVSI